MTNVWKCILIILRLKNVSTNMPLNKKGIKIEAAFEKEYGAKKGKSIFYATVNKGKIKDVKKKTGKSMLAK